MSQQVLTFPSQGSVSRRLVPGMGAMVDYESMAITPCTLDVIGSCLKRLSRYGVHVGPSARSSSCSILTHSMYTGELSKRIAEPYMNDLGLPAGSLVAGMAGATHDVGKIFGGSLPAMVPEGVRRGMDEYQGQCRSAVLAMLGYPAIFCELIGPLVELCSLLCIKWEMEAIGSIEAFHYGSWCSRVEALAAACPVVSGWNRAGLSVIADSVFSDLGKKGDPCSIDVVKVPSRWRSLAAPEIVIGFPFSSGDGGSCAIFSAWDRAEIPTGAWGGLDHRVFCTWLASISPGNPFGLYDLLDAKSDGMARSWHVLSDGTPTRAHNVSRSSS